MANMLADIQSGAALRYISKLYWVLERRLVEKCKTLNYTD